MHTCSSVHKNKSNEQIVYDILIHYRVRFLCYSEVKYNLKTQHEFTNANNHVLLNIEPT